MPPPVVLPAWAADLVRQYESDARSQFILSGNIRDRFVLPLDPKPVLGSLTDYLFRVLMQRFDVILTYDLGNGIRVEKGEQVFAQWPLAKEQGELPKAPRLAIETLTRYFRYCANLARLNRGALQIGCVIKDAHLIAPALIGGFSYDLNALASLIRDWSSETLLFEHTMATFLLAENLNDLHPLLVNNNRAATIKVPLPSSDDLRSAFGVMLPDYPVALAEYQNNLQGIADQLIGATLGSTESLLKTKQHDRQKLTDADLVLLKKQLVEGDCNGLVEFIDSKKTLDDLYGQEKIKTWLRQDIALWKQNDLSAMPMGYLICGPVGTGKTFMVECLAGEAGVPVVKFKNFRDKWVGSTEGNLEKMFRILHALGRCIVFIDEADQALGKRDSGADDSGISGRIYSMMATEMSNTANRGKIIWVLASSRPDLIEVDLKRPGRVDVKIPIFPTTTASESAQLLAALCKRRNLEIDPAVWKELEPQIPILLTPGAAETLAVKLYRQVRVDKHSPADALRTCLKDYQNPVSPDILKAQIAIAVREASDLDFVPACFRSAS